MRQGEPYKRSIIDQVWLDVELDAKRVAAALSAIRGVPPTQIIRVENIHNWGEKLPVHLLRFSLTRLQQIEDNDRHSFASRLYVMPGSGTPTIDTTELCRIFNCRALVSRAQVDNVSDVKLEADPENPYRSALFDATGYRGVVFWHPIDEVDVAPSVANDEIASPWSAW